jgi:hypothetical protein
MISKSEGEHLGSGAALFPSSMSSLRMSHGCGWRAPMPPHTCGHQRCGKHEPVAEQPAASPPQTTHGQGGQLLLLPMSGTVADAELKPTVMDFQLVRICRWP